MKSKAEWNQPVVPRVVATRELEQLEQEEEEVGEETKRRSPKEREKGKVKTFIACYQLVHCVTGVGVKSCYHKKIVSLYEDDIISMHKI